MSDVAHNLRVVREKIEDCAKGKKVELIAVSKTVSTDKIMEAYGEGQRAFGENRMQELRDKVQISTDIDWHFIGKLQKNKVKYGESTVSMIQSVDSLELAKVIEKTFSKPIPVLLQVNIGEEPQKSGFLSKNLLQTIALFENLSKIKIMGFMCIPPNVDNPTGYFEQMNDLFKSAQDLNLPFVDMKYLSMGMSNDFEKAIASGSNMVRVGSGIFGKRL